MDRELGLGHSAPFLSTRDPWHGSQAFPGLSPLRRFHGTKRPTFHGAGKRTAVAAAKSSVRSDRPSAARRPWEFLRASERLSLETETALQVTPTKAETDALPPALLARQSLEDTKLVAAAASGEPLEREIWPIPIATAA